MYLFIDDQLAFFLAMQQSRRTKIVNFYYKRKRFLAKKNEIVRVINIESEHLGTANKVSVALYQYCVHFQSIPRRSDGLNSAKCQRHDSGVSACRRHGSYAQRRVCVRQECDRTVRHRQSDVASDWNSQRTVGTRNRHCSLEHQLDEWRTFVDLQVKCQAFVLWHANT